MTTGLILKYQRTRHHLSISCKNL